ncbi:cyclic-phosphate processing receiver domain-containing protein [Paenibacillus sp. YIM B09110]|uniref:cyclic-phosphate processing receiver domain-containing protein n=1 Tax=Paenibacillus sp. YIM B09110 TaxID=3126102 RepID=UPI00301DFED0
MKLFLDDRRRCPAGYRLARTANMCIAIIKANRISVLSLDYNLGLGQPKGSTVAKYIAANAAYPAKIIIHSNDRLGRIRMYQHLVKHKPRHAASTICIRPIKYNPIRPDSLNKNR